MSWLIPASDMTPEQLRAIQLPSSRHRVIFGAPGSGKTQILLHRTRYLLNNREIDDNSYRVFVFTNLLRDYIQSALPLLKLSEKNVLTFDHWCNDFYTAHIADRVPWDKSNKRPDYMAVKQGVYGYLQEHYQSRPLYQAVFVDEGQDLDPVSFAIIQLIARHVTVCMDHKQQIYEHGSTEHQILKNLGMSQRNISLLSAFRCCPYIAWLSSQFIRDKSEKDQYLRQVKMAQVERQLPLLYYAKDMDDEKNRVAELIRNRQLKGDRIAILYPTNRQVFGFSQGLKELGVETEVPTKKRKLQDNYKAIDFQTDLPKVMTYHGAKGLTFDTVIMPQLKGYSFQHLQTDWVERLLFVGISRATKWVCFCTEQDKEHPVLEKIKPMAKQKYLTIQYAGEQVSEDSQPSANIGQSEDILDLL
jgi:superfamily I DNA/RNA helicase